MTPHGVVELWREDKRTNFLVNRQRVKHYWVDYEDRQKISITFADA